MSPSNCCPARPIDIGFAKLNGCGTGFTVPDDVAVDPHHRHHKARGGGNESFSGLFRFGDSERPFLNILRHERQNSRTGDAVQDISIQRVSHQHAIVGDDMSILRRAFGDDAAAFHPGVVCTLGNCFVLHQRGV